MNPGPDPHKETMGWFLLIALIAVYLLIFIPKAFACSDLWVSMPLLSHHTERKAYNEKNWGVGLECKQGEQLSFVGGTYRNSFRIDSTYAGILYSPTWTQIDIREMKVKFGLLGMMVSGYSTDLQPVVIPVVQLEFFKKGGLDALIAPDFIGLSFKFNFNVLN